MAAEPASWTRPFRRPQPSSRTPHTSRVHTNQPGEYQGIVYVNTFFFSFYSKHFSRIKYMQRESGERSIPLECQGVKISYIYFALVWE